MKNTNLMNEVILLDPLMTSLRSYLLQEIQEYAKHLKVPYLWMLQFLNTNYSPNAKDVHGVSVLANGILQSTLRNYCGVDTLPQDGPEHELGEETSEAGLCATCAFEVLSGKLDSYYDFYAALTTPEMIGKPNDWEMHTESGPFSKKAFQEYVRSTVPQERHEQVFGKAA